MVIPLTTENLILLPTWDFVCVFVFFFFCNIVQCIGQAQEAHGTGDYNHLTLLIYNRSMTATLELLVCEERGDDI